MPLRAYQKQGAEWLVNRPPGVRGRILADPPGYGKTPCAVAAARLELERNTVDETRCIPVFCPAIARSDWHREIKAFWPEAKYVTAGWDEPSYQRVGETDEAFEGRRDEMVLRAMHAKQPTFLLASYEQGARIHDFMLDHGTLFPLVILDEAHYLKKESTLRTRAIKPLVARSSANFLLTGTPIHNRPIDLHPLLELCTLSKFGTRWSFAGKYFAIGYTAHGAYIGDLLDKEGLAEAIKPYVLVHSEREAFGELPARIRTLQKIKVPGSTDTIRLSPAQARAIIAAGNGDGIDRVLRDAAPLKISAAVELAKQLDEPVVLYAYTRADAATLCRSLNKAKVPALLATGDLDPKARAALIERWKHGEATALVCTLDAVRESATLTRASAMIFIDLDWLPGKQLQCEGRIDPSRQPEDQRRPARYYYIVIDHGPDEIIAEAVMHKISDMQGVVSMSENMGGFAKLLEQASGNPAKDSATVLRELGERLVAWSERVERVGGGLLTGLVNSDEEDDDE